MSSTLFFKNMKSIPTRDSSEYEAFFREEREKIVNGVTIDGVYFSGWLYWHLNHWKLSFDNPDLTSNKPRLFEHPQARDNEWIIAEGLMKAQEEKTGICIFGSRQLGKSEFEASWMGRLGTMFENSDNIIVASNENDIRLLTGKLDKGLNALHPFFKHGKIDDNWKKEVTLGFKDKSTGERHPWSKYLIRNTKGGLETEVIAGATPIGFVYDEALEENTLLYYKDKVTTIKDVKVGDFIYGNDGKLTQVLEKVDPGVVNVYKITFSDKRTIECSDNHLWTVYNTTIGKYQTKTFEEIRNKYYYEKYDKRYNKIYKSLIYSIDINSPIEYSDKDLDIDPYFLGCWLGDGYSDSLTVCNIDDDIIEYCEEYARQLGLQSTITWDVNKGNGKFRKINIHNNWLSNTPLREAYKKHNLFKNKHIPKEFLYSSFEQRLALLQGLLDTDGSCDSIGHIEFSTVFPQLAKDFEFLCRSLGISLYYDIIKNTYTHKQEKKLGKNTYRFHLSTDLKIFKLQRKLANYNITDNKKQKAYKERVTISNIEYVGKRQSYCIKVDNESKLFLAGNFIGTHNCGKAPFLQVLAAAKPAFMGPYGWRLVPIFTGTGGSFEKGNDAQELFENPGAYNFLKLELKDRPGKSYGLFVPGYYRMDGKEKTTIGEYFKVENKESELYKEAFYEKNDEKALGAIKKDIKEAQEAKDPKAELKARMYYPLNVEDCFLSDSGNEFPIELCRAQLKRLEDNPVGMPVDLYLDLDGKVKHKFSSKKPVFDFPVKPVGYKEGVVVIYEMPITNAPYGLYIAGNDPYKHAASRYSDSVGSTYIYKRVHTITGEGYQDTMVAQYAGRPDKIETWYENTRLLLKFYGANCLAENDDYNFIQYMIGLNEAEQYLLHKPEFIKQLIPNSKSFREYGINATEKLINHIHGNIKKYLTEVIDVERDESGNVIRQILGVSRILDPMLLKELIAYNATHGNYDRIRAFGLAQTQALTMTNVGPVKEDVNDIYSAYSAGRGKNKSPFRKTNNVFINKKQKYGNY